MSIHPTESIKQASTKTLNRQIGLYSLAAAVAGVSMLALVEPAVGEVVVTRKTILIPMAPVGMLIPVKISMANNGVDNFVFELTNDPNALEPSRNLTAGGENPNDGVLGTSFFYANASALPRGAKIGPMAGSTHIFRSFIGLMAASTSNAGSRSLRGKWARLLNSHYLGVRFQIKGENHYGWIRLTVKTNSQVGGPFMTATITGYAYETIPNKAILAGTAGAATATAEFQAPLRQASPSLGALAAGAEGMPLWRRETI